jgi:three-Cys-motif partner protein
MNSKIEAVQESQSDWGGPWTEKKLNAFTKYVVAYLTIMKKNPYWKTIYFDGFAGSGNRKEQCKSDLYQQLKITPEEDHVYKGSAERVLKLKNDYSFDFYYFVDTNEESLNKLEIKLKNLAEASAEKLNFKSGDCNHWILELAKALKSNKYAALVFLDPFGMQINWDSIASLKNTRSDIWILVPTGVIVNRLLDRNCELKQINKLESFFGLSEIEIKDVFYKKEKQITLFGEEEIIRKITRPIEQIAKIYAQKLKTIWTYVTEEPLILLNSRGVPIFHFIFASNNVYGVKIADQIIKST